MAELAVDAAARSPDDLARLASLARPSPSSTPLPSMPLSRAVLAGLLLALAVAWFCTLDYRALANPDEGRYAEIPREMVASGDWITPRLNGIKYFFKPPLQYWATAAAYEAFGMHDWTARLWPALTSFAGILLVYALGLRLYGQRAAIYAACVLASTSWYVLFGHLNTLDIGLTFFTTVTLACMILGLGAGTPPAQARRWMLGAYAAMALAALSKGVIGGVIPVGALLFYLLLTRQWFLLRRIHLIQGSLLFMAIAAPWFVLVSVRNPEFPMFFFVHEHLQRYIAAGHGRPGPWWFFLLVQLVGFLPWLWAMFAGLRPAWVGALRAAPEGAFDAGRFLLVWAGFTLLFFSLSSSKLPAYTLAAWPALALLCGHYLAHAAPRRIVWQLAPVAVVAAIGVLASPLLARLGDDDIPAEMYAAFSVWLASGCALLAIGLCMAFWFVLRGRTVNAVITASFAAMFCWLVLLTGYETMSPISSARTMAATIRPMLGPGTALYSLETYDQSFPWYLRQTLKLVSFNDEFSFGLSIEPEKQIATLDAFSAAWRTEHDGLALMRPATFDVLLARGLPMVVVARDPTRIVVRTPAAGE